MKIAFNSFNKEELNSVIKQFKLNEFSEGNKTKKFEKILCHYFGRKYCVCVNSGSSANFLVFKSLMLMNNFKGDKKKYSVAISGLCWPTTITAILDSGFDVFFCDVKKSNLNLDLDFLEKNKPDNLKYIVSTPVMGNPKGSDEILEYCKKNKYEMIEDACESFGAQTKKNKIGNIGISSSFSFYFSHHITTIEGGAVLTNNKLQYNLIKSLKSHGWSRNNDLKKLLNLKKKSNIDERWEFLIPGYNMRINELCSAIGITQMNKFKKFLGKRREICQQRNLKINNIKIYIVGNDKDIINSYMGYTIILKTKKNRIQLEKILKENNIDFRPIIAGNIKRHYVNKFYKGNSISLKVCDHVMKNGLVLPVHPFISEKNNLKLIKLLNYL